MKTVVFIFRPWRRLDEYTDGNGPRPSFFYYLNSGFDGIRVSQTPSDAIKKALQKVDGVQRVTVDYESKTDSAALIKATTNADYPGTLATPVSR